MVLAYTAAQFDAAKQAAYKRAVAKMAATHADNVDIAFAAQASSRRLLSDDGVAGLPYVSVLCVCLMCLSSRRLLSERDTMVCAQR